MAYKRLLQGMIGVIFGSFLLGVGCTPQATPSQIPPTNTATAIPKTETPTAVPPKPTIANLGGVWSTGADIPTPRWDAYPCVVDGKIYLIGGDGHSTQATNIVEVYDPATDTWETKSPMPTSRQVATTSEVNGKIYVIGGVVSSDPEYWDVETFNKVEEYDPATDTWTTKSPMPTSRGWHIASVVDGLIYIMGGSKDGGASNQMRHVLTVEVYDPVSDTWFQKNDMPHSRAAGSGSVVDGKIYLFGGYQGKRRVDEYDPSNDSWTTKAEMPTARYELTTSELNGKIYIIGGYDLVGETAGISFVDVYDPATDTWATASDMPTGRSSAFSAVVNGKIYVFGGLTVWPSEPLGIVEIYDPQGD